MFYKWYIVYLIGILYVKTHLVSQGRYDEIININVDESGHTQRRR